MELFGHLTEIIKVFKSNRPSGVIYQTLLEFSPMKKLFLALAALFFISVPFTAFAESPLGLSADAKAEAQKHNQEGVSHYNKGHFDIALKHFEASEKIQRTGEVYFNEALVYDKLGKHGKATMHFKEAKTLANGNSKILNSEVLKAHLKKH